MKNLELKVEVKDFYAILQNITSLGAKRVDTLYQTDRYFLIGEKRLKLRDVNGGSQLIYYSRPNHPNSRLSRYYIFTFKDQQRTVIEKLLNMFLAVKAVVIKKRVLYQYKHTRIHLDEVENLGNFLELETVLDESIPQNNFYEEHDAIINALELSRYKKIKSSYSDLVFK